MLSEQYEKYPQFYKRWGDPSEQIHSAYDSWLQDMASRPGAELEPFEFDVNKHPEQDVYYPKLDGADKYSQLPDWLFYGGINILLSKSLGFLACQRLINQLKHQPTSDDDESPLMDRLIDNQNNGRNTMVVTSHFTFPELGLFKGLRFYAKRDRQRINMGGVVMSKLMTRQSYHGKKIVDQFTPVSDIYFSYPKSASAERHGVPSDVMMLGNALFMKELKPVLDNGGLELDVALTGRQMLPIRKDNGEVDHYEIPPVGIASINLIERFDDIFGATMIMSPVTNTWEMKIDNLIDIKEALKTKTSSDIVAGIYRDIAKSTEEFTGKEIDCSKVISTSGE
jgi:hypothetical protein